ncbi:MAG: HEAT repeat domain-containing protein, partial [Planctomycetota bacterium]
TFPWTTRHRKCENFWTLPKAMMLREDGPPAPEIAFAISRIRGPSSRAFLIEKLSSPNAKTRAASAYGLLWRSNHQAVGPLAERLSHDDDDRVRVQAAQTLGVIGGAEAAGTLEQALADPSLDVRYAAAKALVEIDGRHKDAAALVAALEDEDPAERGAAASALANTEGNGVTAALIGALQEDSHTYPRFAAARALGERGDAKAVQPLIEALRDDERLVRTEAADALGNLGDAEAVEALGGALDDLPHPASTALGKIGGARATDVLIEALRDGNYSAIEALGEIGDRRAVPVLLDHLDLSGAGKAIGKCADESVLPELTLRVKNSAGEELRQATIALGYIGGEEAVQRLVVVSRSSITALRKSAIEALGRTREPDAMDTVVFALENDPRQVVRLVAAEAVGRIGGERALPILLEKLRDENPSVREGAAWGLGHLGDTAGVEPLIEALEDENGLVRIVAVKALGRLGDQRAVEPLEQMLWDPYTATAAKDAKEQLCKKP